jgi:nitrogen-specific signal transduction histidine kinase
MKNGAKSGAAEPAEKRLPTSGRRPVEHDTLLGALPHPILVLAEHNRFVFANAAAESFLSTSSAVLKRQTLDEVVAFGCPLLALVDQVRRSGVQSTSTASSSSRRSSPARSWSMSTAGRCPSSRG